MFLIILNFVESRTRDITAYVHSTDVNESGPLPPEAEICGSHPGHLDDGAIITFQCKPPMYVIISISFSKECTLFCLMILMEYNTFQIRPTCYSETWTRNNRTAQSLWSGGLQGYKNFSCFYARKRSLRRLCFYVCLSFCSQGYVCLSACWDTPPGTRHPP